MKINFKIVKYMFYIFKYNYIVFVKWSYESLWSVFRELNIEVSFLVAHNVKVLGAVMDFSIHNF
jgi:hypothetical protein